MNQTDPRATWRSADLGTPRTISLPAGEVQVFESGTGRPVVLVNGLLVNANLWRGVTPLLAHRFHTVAIDMPMGSHTLPLPDADLTPPGLAALVAATIEALDLGPVTLVGNDTGGAVCQLVAVGRPDLVARLVLTSCDAYDRFPPQPFGLLTVAAKVPGVLAALAHGALAVPALRNLPLAYGWLATGTIPTQVTDSYVFPLREDPLVRDDLRRLLIGIDTRHTLAAAERFGDFAHPVLIAWSEKDKFFPARYAERLAGDFPDARIEWIAGARTFSAEDQPERLAAAITTFAGQVTAA